MTDYNSKQKSDPRSDETPIGDFVLYDLEENVEVDIKAFLSEWNEQIAATKKEDVELSTSFLPHAGKIMRLKRFDIFGCRDPLSQQASSDPSHSLEIRRSDGWSTVRSIFFIDQPLAFSNELHIEIGNGPIRRQRVSYLIESPLCHHLSS